MADPAAHCTFLVVPCRAGDPHMKFLGQPEVTILAHVDSHSEPPKYYFRPPNHWQGQPKGPMQGLPEPPKHTMLVVAVTNPQGREQILTPSNTLLFSQHWGRGPPTSLTSCLPNCPLGEFKPPRALQRLLEAAAPLKPAPLAIPPVPYPGSLTPSRWPCTHPLSAPPNELMIFTDGSCMTPNEGPTRIGAAVYCLRPQGDDRRDTFKVNPNGRGYTLTINRAELSAILKALSTPEVAEPRETIHLYTDSLCSMHLIHRIINSPWTLKHCKHWDLLQNILEALRLRAEAGARTYIYKIRAHADSVHNDAVDLAAKEAAMADNRDDQLLDASDNDPYSKGYWIATRRPARSDEFRQAGTTAPAPPQAQAEPLSDENWAFVPNLTQALKKRMKQRCSAGQFTEAGIYASAWHAALPTLDKQSSSFMWRTTRVTARQRLLTLKARWGHLWNRKLAYRYKMARNDNCPLCGHHDSVGHLLGSCSHPTAVAMRIARHDGAVRKLQKHLSKCSMRGFFTIMDACALADLPPEVQSKRIPTWLLPQVEPDTLRRMRPDLLIIEGLKEPSPATDPALIHQQLCSGKYTFHILEVGYCCDTNQEDKDLEKQQQHATLRDLLAAEFPTARIKYYTVPLGRAGAIPASLVPTLKDLGLTSCKATFIAEDLHIHALQCLEQMFNHRNLVDAPHTADGPRLPNLNPLKHRRSGFRRLPP